MVRARSLALLPVEFTIFYLLTVALQAALLLCLSIPIIEFIERHPLTIVSASPAGWLMANGSMALALFLPIGLSVAIWWRWSLGQHYAGMKNWAADKVNYLFRNAVPPSWIV